MNAPAGARLFAPQRWAEVRALADRLDSLPPAHRRHELDAVAASDPELAGLVHALLEQGDATVAEPLQAAIDSLTGEGEAAVPAQIGAFRLVRRIGAGGMGVVYLAEREGADFTQRVALKLLDGNMARMARFAARERRILSALAHPNITAFVDAGTEGRSTWLAMEYVDGEPLLDYCRRHALDLHGRVALFDQVCSAVAHAHAQLVVHRDLKPSNVLVSTTGAAKLLDFGIAQILDATDDSQPATRVFTPEYASPEQLRGDRATTATDVYSLGLMLYEIVTGRRLPTIGRRGDGDWTTAELAQLATTQPVADSSLPAAPEDVRALARQLRGDLGRIIAHCVAAEPAQRYLSVALLREDLMRWVQHRPLTIARPGIAYALNRFVRRHRVAVSISAAALAALLGLSIVALWQARRATAMAAQADHARTFLADLLAGTDPFAAKKSGANTAQMLSDGAQRIEREFGDAPDMQADLRATIASVLDRIGEPKQARDLMLRSVEQLRQLHGPRSPKVGAALERLATAREDSGDLEGARADFSEAYSILQGTSEEYAKARIGAVTGLAKLANLRGDYADAERMHQAVLKERLASEGPESAEIAMDLMNLAADELYAERYSQAEDLAQHARAMLEKTVGPRHARNIYVDNVLGLAQISVGHTEASLATLRAALDLARTTLQPGALMIGNVMASLGNAELTSGDYASAIATLTEARKLNEAAKNPRRGASIMMLGLAQLRSGQGDALKTLHDASEVLTSQNTSNDPAYTAWCAAAYAAALAATGDIAEAERIGREARSKLLASPRAQSVRLGEVDLLLADVLERKGVPAEAGALREEALATFKRVYGDDHPRTRALASQLTGGGNARRP